ncbi:MAG TPA: glycosyltransferase family 39 protein [Thermoleophilaceae bacterium]
MGRPYPIRALGSPVSVVALAVAGVCIAFAHGYGFHRDELYFMEAGKHPAWGYDDQPPLTPLIARAATAIFGASPTGLRIPSALALAACVALAALTARELGAGRGGQVVAAVSLGGGGALFLGHLVSTTTYDFLAWTVLVYLAVRIVGRGEERAWLAFGAVLGVALLNKWLPLTLVAALVAGLAADGRLSALRSRWAAAAALIALAIWLPNLIWQANHGWPQRELAGQIADEDPLGTRLGFLPFQLVIMSPFLAFVWIKGLLWLVRAPEARRFRWLGFAYVALLVLCVAGGAKEYYAVGFYPALFAAGGITLESWLRRPRAPLAFGGLVAVSAAVGAVIAFPVIPASSVGDSPVTAINEDALETIGWPRFTDWVAGEWRGLPATARRRGVIVTVNYGEAGAIERFGPSRGLPRAYSGHNSFASFGRPPDGAAPVVVVGDYGMSFLESHFRGCRVVSHFDNGYGVDNEEQGAPLTVCTAPREPWRTLWPKLHHLNA